MRIGIGGNPRDRMNVRARFAICRRSLSGFLVAIAMAFSLLGSAPVYGQFSVSDSSFSWANVNGMNFTTPIVNQGQVNTCWAFASAGVMECMLKITRDDPTYQPYLSEQYMIDMNYGGIGGSLSQGGYVTMPLTYAGATTSWTTTPGILSAAELPYTASSAPAGWTPNTALAPGWQDRTAVLGGYFTQLTNPANASVKADLLAYGPLIVTLLADNDWYPSDTSESGDSHAAVIIGWQDNSTAPGGGYYIVKNSWGTGWGNSGYGEISYATLANATTYTISGSNGVYDFTHEVYALTGPAWFNGPLVSATWSGSGGTSWSAAPGNSSWTVASSLGVSQNGSPTAWINGETAAVFNTPAAGPISLDNNLSANSLTINPGAVGYSFSGGSLTLTSGGIVAGESMTISSPLTLGATQTWTVAAGKVLTVSGPVDMHISSLTIGGNGSTVISGNISDYTQEATFAGLLSGVAAGSPGGAGSLTMNGNGALTLGGNNTYTGTTLVNSGTLVVANSLALQDSFVDLNGGALNLNGLSATLGGLTGGGTVAIPSGQTLTVGDNGAMTTFAGMLTGNGGSLVVTGSGEWSISTNTFSGTTLIAGGTLRLTNSASLQDSTLDTSGSGALSLGTLKAVVLGGIQGPGNLHLSHSLTLTVGGNNGTTTYSGNLSGNGASVVEIGNGDLTLSGSNSYTGGTTIASGTLTIAADDSLASSGFVTISGGGRLVLGSGAGLGALLGAGSPDASGLLALQPTQTLPAVTTTSLADLGLLTAPNPSDSALTAGSPSDSSPAAGVSSSPAAAVPEPASWALAAVATLCGLVWRRRHCLRGRNTI